MKKIVSIILISFSAIIGSVIVNSTPVMAADGYYSPTACWGGAPYNSQYRRISISGYGWDTDYKNVYTNGTSYRIYASARDKYLSKNSECGYFGMLISTYSNPTTVYFYMYNPNVPCGLKWIGMPYNGLSSFEGGNPRHFC